MADPKDQQANAGQEPAEDEIIEGEIVEESEADAPEAQVAGAESGQVDVTTTEEYKALAEELQQAQAKGKEYFDGWQRERADFANYKRRVDRDQQNLASNIKGDIVKHYLGVLDDLERALKARPTDGAAASWANGIELIARKLQTILENEGVQRIPAETEEFNPNRHEAISYEESPDHSTGQIIEVVQQGYTLGDRVLRPALVRVAR